jgi:two-component system cell cycle sensor histidine kinase/response regulator CckA
MIQPAMKLRILVVEDDQAARTLMVTVLKEAGFEVLNAANGREAIRLMINPDGVDLLVTDVNRPWPDGIVVARHARALHPDIPILFVAGDAERSRLTTVPGPYRSLPQPFTRAGLEAALDAMRRESAVE